MWFALHNEYPYVVYRLEGVYFGSVRDDSGLMEFSKWPVVDPAFNPRDCMPAVEGMFIKADFNGEWMTEDAKDYIGFRSFADKSGWDSFATKGVGYVRLRSFDRRCPRSLLGSTTSSFRQRRSSRTRSMCASETRPLRPTRGDGAGMERT